MDNNYVGSVPLIEIELPGGARGLKGDQGPKGDKGDNYNPIIEEVETLEPTQPATAEVRADDNNIYFSFGIPKGEPGEGTKLSDFDNDVGFVTADTTELENYALISNTYTKTEVDNSLSSKVNTSDVINNLTSTETAKPLSANQGKVLNEAVEGLDERVNGESTIQEEGTNLTLENTTDGVITFKNLKGNTTQEGTPTPENPVNVNVVTGEQEIEVANGTETQTHTINLGDIELCKIGDYQDRIYKDSGKWYLEKNIVRYDFSASDNWWGPITYNTSEGQRIRWNISKNSIHLDYKFDTKVYCNVLKYSTQTEATSSGEDNIIVNTSGWYLSIAYNGTNDRATMNNYFESIGTKIYLVLEAPTTTEITDTTLINQLNALENARSYKGQTSISVDGDLPVILDLEAYTNTLDGNVNAISKNNSSSAVFDTIYLMKSADLKNGATIQTLGYYAVNDGGSAIYKIRTKTNEDITNEMNLIALNDTTLVAELIIENNIINIKQFGAYGDGTHDDYNVLNVAFNNYKNLYIPNGTYLSNSLISVNNDNLYIKGENNSILKYPSEASSEITNNQCFITFNNSDYIKIENIKIDCGGTYIVRPYLWQTSDYNTYRTKRYLTYNGIRTNNCDYTIIENIEIYNCCVGIMSNDSCFQTFNNIFIHDTFADGIRIGTGCENSNITNCLFNNLGDDCVAILHENGNVTEDYKPKNIIVDNINGKDCFGAIITILSAENCHCYNSILIDNKDYPIKLGSSGLNYVSKNCSIENVNVITSKRVEGDTYDTEANNIAHGIVSISGSNAHEQNNCILKDCTFESSNGDNKLYRIDGNGYIIDNCQFIGYACRTYNLSNLKMYNCVFRGNDGSYFNTITNSIIENCDFYNNKTYSWNTTRGLTILENENCIYKNVYSEGTSTSDNRAISLFTGSNKGNIFFSSKYNLQPNITNVTNIYSDGVLIFTLDAFYSAATFKIGQQVYWTNQNKLYVKKSTGLVEL